MVYPTKIIGCLDFSMDLYYVHVLFGVCSYTGKCFYYHNVFPALSTRLAE